MRYEKTHRLIVSHGRWRSERLVRPNRRGEECASRGLLAPPPLEIRRFHSMKRERDFVELETKTDTE